MAFTISVKSDFEKLAAGYRESQQKQVRYAARIALNNVAKAAVAEIQSKMPAIFDRPTPSTVNSQFVRYATADNLVASVAIKDFAGKHASPQDWLAAEILGGDRRHKRSENALINVGLMEPDQFWTPGQGLETAMDAYGNVSGARIVQALSRVSAFGQQGYDANATERTRDRLVRKKLVASKRTGTDFFVWRDSDGRPKALMQLLGKGDVEPILLFVDRKPIYRSRLPFDDLVLAYVEAHVDGELAKCLELAFATAR